MTPKSDISKCPEYKVKSKIGNIFVNEKILKEYNVKIYETDPYFCEYYKEKIQVHENGREYTLFGIDVYFSEYLLAVEIDEKKHTARDLLCQEKDKKHQKKSLILNLLELIQAKKATMQVIKLDRIVRIQTFINKFKNRQFKKLEKESNRKIKKITDKIKQNFKTGKSNQSIKSKCLNPQYKT